MSACRLSQKPSFAARSSTSGLASWPAISFANPPRRAAWAMEEPIRPRPMMAILFIGSISGRHELLQQRHRQPILFFGAHRYAQAIRQPIAGNTAQDDAAFHQKGVRLGGGLFAVSRKMNQHEIGHAVVHARARFSDF